MSHPVTWFQITGGDGKALESFYKKVFNWKMTSAPGGGMKMVEKDAPDGIPGGVGAAPDGNSSVSVYVNVASVTNHLKKIEKAGGQMAFPPMELEGGWGTIAGFKDPMGNLIGLWQPPAQMPMSAQPTENGAKKNGAKKNGAKKATAKKAGAKSAPKAAKKAPAAKKAGKSAPKAAKKAPTAKKTGKSAPKKAGKRKS